MNKKNIKKVKSRRRNENKFLYSVVCKIGSTKPVEVTRIDQKGNKKIIFQDKKYKELKDKQL